MGVGWGGGVGVKSHFPDCLVLMARGCGIGADAPPPSPRTCSAPTRFKSSVSPRANRGRRRWSDDGGLSSGRTSWWGHGGGGGRPPKVQGAREAADFLFGTPGCGGGGGAGGPNGRGTDVHYLLSLLPPSSAAAPAAALSDLWLIRLLYLASTSFR